jgi:AcrR family transcriptional regulator
MPYRSTDKTRQKKDAKRTAMMQAAVEIFSERGYQSATIRDIVKEADVSIGTFYFYFPDKETLFVHLYQETADFLIHTLQQAANSRTQFPQQVKAILQAYVSIAIFEPAVVELLLVAGVGTVPALTSSSAAFREKLIQIWQRPLSEALKKGQVPDQNERRTAEGLSGAIDQVILGLLARPDREEHAAGAVRDMQQFVLRATGHYQSLNT